MIDSSAMIHCLKEAEKEFRRNANSSYLKHSRDRYSELASAVEYALELFTKKEPEEKNGTKEKILKTIADNQLSIGGADPLTDYEQGMWDGLQTAYEIVLDDSER